MLLFTDLPDFTLGIHAYNNPTKKERFYPQGNKISFCYDPRRASSTRNHVCRLASPRIRCAMALRTTTGKAFIYLASSLSLAYLR